MDDEQRRGWWRKAVAVGGAVLVVLLILMVVGLVVGRKGDSSGESPQKDVTEIEGLDVLPAETNAADMMRRIESETGGEEAGVSEEKSGVVPPVDEDATTQYEAPTNTQQAAGTQTSAKAVPNVEVKTIRTASLAVEIEKGAYNEAYSTVSLIAEGVGGYISDSRSSASEGRITSGTVTIRIPNSSYADVMRQLQEMGEVTSISEQAQDVTEEYVDLESRTRNLRAQEAVYLNLMAKAQTIEESISVQRELSVIQEQIEQLTGRKNYLDNHVQFSTIQVTLTEPGAEEVVNGDGWGFVDALSEAAHGVVDGLSAVIRFTGNALVYIVILALIALGLYFGLRKFEGRKE